MKRRYGFTLIELLVVVAIIALLVSILMPALGRARELANQVKCGTQLNGIGKAFALYGNDYKDAYPRTSPSSPSNNNLCFFRPSHPEIPTAAQMHYVKSKANAMTGFATYSCTMSSLYLLIKYEDLVPNMFICPSSDSATEMDLSEAIADATTVNDGLVVESWDDLQCFKQFENCSYCYNDPYKNPLDSSSSSSMPAMADQNPCFNYEATGTTSPAKWTSGGPLLNQNPLSWDWEDSDLENDTAKWRPGNSPNHGYDAQNVLFADSHVKKYDKPTVGIQDDNIYTFWDTAQLNQTNGHTLGIELGKWGLTGAANLSQNQNDSYLAL